MLAGGHPHLGDGAVNSGGNRCGGERLQRSAGLYSVEVGARVGNVGDKRNGLFGLLRGERHNQGAYRHYSNDDTRCDATMNELFAPALGAPCLELRIGLGVRRIECVGIGQRGAAVAGGVEKLAHKRQLASFLGIGGRGSHVESNRSKGQASASLCQHGKSMKGT